MMCRAKSSEEADMQISGMPENDEALFRNDLLPGERIQWTGRPVSLPVFSFVDFFLLPFGVAWNGIIGFFIYTSIKEGAPIFFLIFSIPFVGVGLYLLFGRFFSRAAFLKNTRYAVTDSRILALTTKRGVRSLSAYEIKKLESVNKRVQPDGAGTIFFSDTAAFTAQLAPYMPVRNTSAGYAGLFSLCGIPGADNVYNIIYRRWQELGGGKRNAPPQDPMAPNPGGGYRP